MIDLTHAEREAFIRELQTYCEGELDMEIGGFDAGFLLDFIITRLGVRFYNKGLADAETIVRQRLEDVSDAVLALEQTPQK